MKLVLFLLACTITAIAQVPSPPFGLTLAPTDSSGNAPCGPPTYPCSSQSLATVSLPATIPNVGGYTGSNTVLTPSDFGVNRIVRCTDAHTDSTNVGASWLTNASGADAERHAGVNCR